MSKNFDKIAVVDIDLKTPIVDDTSFDHILIMGPPPKSGGTYPAVGSYADISEVEEAGFVTVGEDADPIGVAALVAFSQSPKPDVIYIAVQKYTAEALSAQQTIAVMNAALDKHTTAYEKVNCSVKVDKELRDIVVTLTAPFAEADGHGLFQALDEFVQQGYTATVDDITVEHYGQFKQTKYDAQLLAMKKGDAPISFTFMLKKEGTPDVAYGITVAFPDTEKKDEGNITALALASVDGNPENELEGVVDTINRALAHSGWYALCPAGIDPADYETIAAKIEAEEKMFLYEDAKWFAKDGVSHVGGVYFRSMGIFNLEDVEQKLEAVPAANWYSHVAFAVRWLGFESGSETAAFKSLAAIYPSNLSSAQMDALEKGNMNYFITVGNKNITMHGITRGGEWADVIRFRDWLKYDMQKDVVSLFVANPKIPYTDKGIALVQNRMMASLKRGQKVGGIAEDEYDEDGNTIPGFQTSVPLAASIPASEKASRKLRRCKFKARLAGAIHFAEINGSLTYEL